MTQPRVPRADIEPTYAGRYATTRYEEHPVTSPDGSTFVASLYHVVDADRDLSEVRIDRFLERTTAVPPVDFDVLVQRRLGGRQSGPFSEREEGQGGAT